MHTTNIGNKIFANLINNKNILKLICKVTHMRSRCTESTPRNDQTTTIKKKKNCVCNEMPKFSIGYLCEDIKFICIAANSGYILDVRNAVARLFGTKK